MISRPPLLSGRKIVRVFLKIGYRQVGQRGSHIKISNDDNEVTLIIPDHKEVDRWTLKGILKDAGLSVDDFLSLL